MLYCDKCAVDYDRPHTTERQVGECEICKRRMGNMNIMPDDVYEEITNGINTEEIDVSGFTVQEVKGFIPGTKTNDIEPNVLIVKKVAPNCAVFFDNKRIVIADPKTGKRFQIKY